jgi:AraC-like DNA-binding protein
LAQREAATVMPAYTHNQQAQPTTFGHYLGGVAASLARDAARLLAVWGRTNLSTLGAAALAGTGFPVDRAFEGSLLGFDGLVENTYDAVASADSLAELVSVNAVMAAGLSRFTHDLLVWTSNEAAAIGRMQQICEYISKNFCRYDLSLGEIAMRFNMSESYMSISIKDYLGQTFQSHVEKLRIDRANSLLASGKYPIAKVAEAVGYLSPHSFRRAYKRSLEYNPSKFLASDNQL